MRLLTNVKKIETMLFKCIINSNKSSKQQDQNVNCLKDNGSNKF